MMAMHKVRKSSLPYLRTGRNYLVLFTSQLNNFQSSQLASSQSDVSAPPCAGDYGPSRRQPLSDGWRELPSANGKTKLDVSLGLRRRLDFGNIQIVLSRSSRYICYEAP